ncbi:hypothetical protein [Hyphomicrobium sp. NDB2Meth4]|uniref:hypothetical protein n=1 Tax=Hyphomicrobium sp. NDB2Meth4 TaxID=1892846 RepID=UPI000B300B44|nr:hypothetical protein [Hyphomicrobium sp. NDB2Meth4]
MSFSIPRMVLAALAAMLTTLAVAQTIPKQKGPARIFAQFDFYCLKHIPDLTGIERAAGFGEYDQLLGDDLAPYVPETRYDKLLGWRYHDHGDEFILTAMRGEADDAVKREAPAFAAATGTTCALRVPNSQPGLLLGELTRAVGRPADKTWLDGATRVYSWTHQKADTLSFIQFHAPEIAGAKAMLSASLFVKKR